MEFFNKAKAGNNHVLLYMAGIACVYLGINIGYLPLNVVLSNAIKKNPALGTDALDSFNSDPNFGIFGIDSNMGFMLLLLSFVAGFIVFYLAFPRLHKRTFKSLITPTDKIDFKRILFGFIVWSIIWAIMESVSVFMYPNSISYNFVAKSFIPLLLLSLLILPIQTTLEELIFRSYLLQGIGNSNIRISPRMKIIMAWVITSVLFGAIHAANPEVQRFGIVPMMFYYIGAGLFLALITIWDDRLELAIGVHAATNFLGAVIMGYEGAAIQTDSLFKTNEINVIHMTIGFYIGALIFTLICKRKYGWANNPISNYKELT